MSHFLVTITGEKETFDQQMAPFAEQKAQDEFLKFKDCEAESHKEYETGKRPEFFCSSSSSWGMQVSQRLFDTIAKEKPGTFKIWTFGRRDLDCMGYFKMGEYYHCGVVGKGHTMPKKYRWVKVIDIIATNHPDKNVCFEGAIRVEVVAAPKQIKLTEYYPTFEKYMEDYEGYKRPDPKTGKYGYWFNPQAKWDWFQVGGRWAGYFLIKPEYQAVHFGEKPEFGWEHTDYPEGRKLMEQKLQEGRVDTALKRHIDFEAMMQYGRDKAAKRYDVVMNLILKDLPVNESWEVIRNDCKGRDIPKVRDLYWNQPRCAAFKAYIENADNRRVLEEYGIDWFDGNPDEYLMTREQYVRFHGLKAVTTFAILHNGQWAERGRMGSFAFVHNEKDNWEEIFQKILAEIPDETRLTILDCHI